MKKVITTLLAASLLLLGTQAFAQVSFNAGYLNSTQSYENSKSVNSNGAFFGASFNLPVLGGFGIAPGIYYSLIANKNASGAKVFGVDVSNGSKFREHAVNVPVYLNWGADLGVTRDSRFFVYGGPTLQYGLSSKTKLTGNIGTWSADSVLDSYEDDNQNRFNVYLGGGIGMQAGTLQITVGYDYGMMNLYKGDNAAQSHRSNLKIGLGFVF